MKKGKLSILLILLVAFCTVILAMGCGSSDDTVCATTSPVTSPTPSVLPTETVTPTSTPTETPTQTPTETPTQTPTITPTGTPSCSPIITPLPNPTPTCSPNPCPTTCYCIVNYGTFTLIGNPGGGAIGSGIEFGDLWNLAAGELELCYTLDMSAIQDPCDPFDYYDQGEQSASKNYSEPEDPCCTCSPQCTPTIQIGLKNYGETILNPGPDGVYLGGGGGWMTSTVGKLITCPYYFNWHDKHFLTASADRDVEDYDVLCCTGSHYLPISWPTACPTCEPYYVGGPSYLGNEDDDFFAVWFDRDGAYGGGSGYINWYNSYWHCLEGKLYDTKGIYNICIKYGKLDNNLGYDLGYMCAEINGLPQGVFGCDGYQPSAGGGGGGGGNPYQGWPSFKKAGLAFKGQLELQQVFANITTIGCTSSNNNAIVNNLIVKGWRCATVE